MRHGNFGLLIPQGEERDSGYVRLVHGTPYTLQLMSFTSDPADAEVNIDGRPIGTFRLSPHGRFVIETPADDPAHGRLTFYAAESEEGAVAGSGTANADRGLVRVVFRPGKAKYRPTTYPFNGPQVGYAPPRPSWRREVDQSWGVLRSQAPDRDRVKVVDRWAEELTSGSFTHGVTTADASLEMMFASNAAQPGPGPDAQAGVTGLSGTSDQRYTDAPPIEYTPDAEVTITLRLVTVPKAAAVRPLPTPAPRATPVPPPVG